MDAEVAATLILACVYGTIAVAVQLGMMSGGLSLAPVGWMAVGAYCTGLSATTWDQPFFVGWLVAVVIAAGGGPIVMAPVKRVSGLYFALVSLAFVLALQAFLSSLEYTGGPLGIYGVPIRTTLPIAIVVLAGACAAAAWVSSGNRGRRVRAAGQDAVVARTLGVDVYRLQLATGSLSAVIAATGGVFYASYVGYIDPTSYGFALVVQVLAMVVIGGRTHWLGAVIGAFVVGFLPLVLRPLAAERDIVNGAILIAVMVFLPGGIFSAVRAAAAGGRGRLRRRDVAPDPSAHAAPDALAGQASRSKP